MTRILITALVSLPLAGGIAYLLLPVLRALKCGQSIREVGPTWHNYKAGTPMMAGLMFISAALIVLLCNIPFMEDYSVFYVMILSMCFGFIGLLDDLAKMRKHQNEGLTSIQKLLLQLAVSALFLYIMYKHGGMNTHLYIPFVDVRFDIHPVVYIFFAMFVLVGGTNAVNLTDGVDGLSSSVTIPVMIFFTMAAYFTGKEDLALLPASLVGGLIAYLCYNWHPAKLFMGDTGSLFLGGVVSAMAFALDMPLVLILVGFVYICETLSVILQVGYFKLTHGKRLFKMAPIHHHFEKCGWREEKVVIVFAAVSWIMCFLGWLSIQGIVKG